MKEEQIIEAARDLFSTYGYKRVSMDEIAKKANVTKKTVYSYFKSKEDLLKYCINDEINKMKKIVEVTEYKKFSFFKNVHNVIFRLLEYKSESKFLKSIITESEIFGNNVIIDNLKQIDKEIRSYISRRLQEAIDKKYIEVDDVEITAFLIYKMYIALMFEWSDTKIDKQKMADTIIKILRDGLERKKDVKDE